MGKSRRLSRGDVEVDTFDVNDDEAELSALHAAREAEVELVKSPKARGKQGEAAGAGRAADGATAAELAIVYAECIKACNENKVNEKNSWSIDFIDHMSEHLRKPSAGASASPDEDGDTNFQMASCTLDAGVKIYSYRVDSVYSAAYRVLGGLNRTGAAPDEAEADDEAADGADGANGDGPPPTGKKPVRARAAKSAASTLASASSLDGKQGASGLVLDPLFHKLCAKFDLGGARGLLTANMALHGADGLSLLFDGEGEPDIDEAELAAASGKPLSRFELLRLAPSPSAVNELGVCEALGAFVDERMAALGEPNFYGEPHLPAGAAQSYLEPSMAATASASMEPTQLPWLEGDAGNDDCGSYAGNNEEDDERAREAEALLDTMAADDDDDDGVGADLALFSSLDAARDSPRNNGGRGGASAEGEGEVVGYDAEAVEFYGSQSFLGAGWAGPSHWRWNAGAAAAAADATGAVKPAARGGRGGPAKKKVAMILDIANADHAANALAVKAKPVRSSTQLTAAAIAKAAAEPITLPFDHRLVNTDLVKLFGRPHVHATRLRALHESGSGADGGEAEDGEMGMDGGAGSDDDDGAFGASDGFGYETHANDNDTDAPIDKRLSVSWDADGPAGSIGVLNAPAQVQAVDIGYAKVAKKVNIRLLKESIWSTLEQGAAKSKSPDPAQSFKAVMSFLAKSAPAETMKDVSVAYCFICLLHLANEKGLKVEGTSDLTDLTVSL